MWKWIKRYAYWLHLQFPGGAVERLPHVDNHYETNVPGVYVVGDLAGVPLLKFSLDSGTKAVRHIASSASRQPAEGDEVDVAIVGAGAAGMAAAEEARRQGLSFIVLEANRRFATIKDFQEGKPIYTYPKELEPAGALEVTADVKEKLVVELEEQTDELPVRSAHARRIRRERGRRVVELEEEGEVAAQHVIVAIGRSGDFRTLDVPGEELNKVHHRLHDPGAYAGCDALVVGGGDSALEAAIGLTEAGAHVTLAYRREQFFRPKPANLERLQGLVDGSLSENGTPKGSLSVMFDTEVTAIREQEVDLSTPEGPRTLENDEVFATIGRDAPLDFFRRSGIKLRNDWGDLQAVNLKDAFQSVSLERLNWSALDKLNWSRIGAFAAFFLFMCAVYSWKDGGLLNRWASQANVFPFSIQAWVQQVEPDSFTGVLLRSAASPSFYYTLVYSLIVVVFGYLRVKRRKTPYVWWQTVTLAAIQVIPLFILPELVLPYMGENALLPEGLLDALFPVSEYATHGREYWRAYGFILAWPLLVYNVFTAEPLWWWLGICFVQTFVLIPGMIYFWGKGAYCSWICSCGALAETLGDQQRDKMPHGEGWNKFNMAGQVIMGLAFLLLFLRIMGWIWPGSWAAGLFSALMYGEFLGLALNYSWTVDVVLAGMVGYGVYFWLSGRFWCRFLCPLAALMHIYTRFSRFRILSDKKKCISCNVCTSVCHQGIDVMHYAQQGIPMDDPQCVRCSACVQSCPTGVLSFGQVDNQTGQVITVDELEASLARIQEEEGTAHGEGRRKAQGRAAEV